MRSNLFDRIGDWNPQLMRELKKRLKGWLVLLIIVFSIALQGILWDIKTQIARTEAIFLIISVLSLAALLVGGCYAIGRDLVEEERRGTLNFVRMSPQSPVSIFIGKFIGVPILIHLAVALTIPFNLYEGLTAHIPLASILALYAIAIASTIFFYSLTVVLTISSSGAKTALPGLLSVLLCIVFQFSWHLSDDSTFANINGSPVVWGLFFSPFSYLQYIYDSLFFVGDPIEYWKGLNFCGIPIGYSSISIAAVFLGNIALWTYWLWQAIVRCYRAPKATLLRKSQTYWLVTCFQIMMLGFTEYHFLNSGNALVALTIGNLILFFALILMLTPHRQTVQDWSRFRHQEPSSQLELKTRSLKADLLYGEKSPAILAIALNLAIAAIPFLMLLPVFSQQDIIQSVWFGNGKYLVGLVLFLTTLAICATITQILLMLKTPKRVIWSRSTLSIILFILPIFLGMINVNPDRHILLWLLSSFPWVALKDATFSHLFSALLMQAIVLGGLLHHLRRQLQIAGQSQTKVLLDQN